MNGPALPEDHTGRLTIINTTNKYLNVRFHSCLVQARAVPLCHVGKFTHVVLEQVPSCDCPMWA